MAEPASSPSDTPETPDASVSATPATPTPKPPRRWLRRLAKVGIVLLVLLLLAPLALSIGPVRNLIADKIGTALDRKVTIDSAFAYWFHGIDLEGLRIENGEGFEGDLLTCKKVHIDIDALALVGGGVRATIAIDSPVLSLRRNAAGISNLSGLGGDKRDAESETTRDSDKTGTHVSITINDAQIHAEIAPTNGAAVASQPTTLRVPKATFALGESGSMVVGLRAVAVGAKSGGGDADVVVTLDLDGSGSGPFAVTCAELDLARIAPLLQGAGAVETLRGTLSVDGDGVLTQSAGLDGTLVLVGSGLAATLPGGDAVSLGTLQITAEGVKGDARSTFTLDLDADEVAYAAVAAPGSGARPRTFQEPRVTLDAKGAYEPAAADGTRSARVIINVASLDAGHALKASATKPWMLALDERITAQGAATIQVDFSRLGHLHALVPQLRRLRSGHLIAAVNAKQGDGLDISAGARVTGLVVASPLQGGQPFQERDLSLQMRYALIGAASRLDLYTLKSGLVTSTGTSAGKPLIVRMRPGSVVVNGPLGLRVDAGQLSRLIPDLLGLEGAESIVGTFTITGTAEGTPEKSTLTARLATSNLRLPPSFGTSGGTGQLEAAVRAEMTDLDLRLALVSLRGFGIESGSGNAHFVTREDTARLGDSQLHLTAQLAGLRPWLAKPLGLARAARLAGQVTVDIKSVERDRGLALTGQSHLDNIFWQAGPREPPVREGQLSIDHDVWLAPEGERSTLKRLAIALSGLTMDLSGSSFAQQGADMDLDLKGTLRGDAARLAPTLAALLGTDYADLRGTGSLQGSLTATGNPAHAGRDLLLDLSLSAGSWTTSGLSIANTQVTARRAALADPITAVVEAMFNQGPTKIVSTVRPGPGQMPWTLDVDASQVDTSSLIVDHGPGRFLAFALPSLLPSDAKVPVLSGLLDARLQIAAGDVAEPTMLDTLMGTGKIAMTQGEIKNSTLFKSAGGGGKMAQLMKLLARVPEVGKATKSISRALTFKTLESEFAIATRTVTINRTTLAGRYVTVNSRGFITFEQRVDLLTDVRFEGSAGKQLKKLLPDRTIPMRMTGVMPDTKVAPNLDLKKLMASGLLGRAKDKLLGGKKGKKLLKGLKDLIK